MEKSKVLALNGMSYCENTFASFRELFVISLSAGATGNTELFLFFFTGIKSMRYFLFFDSLRDKLEEITFFVRNCRNESFSFFRKQLPSVLFN